MIYRDLEKSLLRYNKFPVVGVFGPRQSGKTTLVKKYYNKHKYLNLEDPDIREFAEQDPRGFLKANENPYGIILDEFQYVPQILSYIQIEADEKKRPGYFVLTGSQNFLMNQAITQSLAGRIGILTLLPLSINELSDSKILTEANQLIINGGYPRIYTENISPEDFYPSYIHSYVERDVRQLVNVENLRTFQKFMRLCASRVGQLLNVSDLAMNCGINQKTVENWLSILEASYILYLLTPYNENFNKRVIKTPKLFFYDTGLVCSLLGIKTSNDVSLSPWKGHLFECLIISDFFKQFYNDGKSPQLYFWRDKNGLLEVDCLIKRSLELFPVEIKSTQTSSSELFKGLKKWQELSKAEPKNSYLVYGGEITQERTLANLISWSDSGNLISKIYEQ